ncbi:uncharacterized protein LOC105663125 [Megachile rotundata]|uniref:uncharacterized protein LOC105663125 n=1 Tax=Megachile rotundata TaxID=143995 RepID=UPI003FD615F5
MGHASAEEHFANFEQVREWLDEWFCSKDKQFFWDGIHKLPERWLVDKALRVQEDKLQWLQENQSVLRRDSLQNIDDFNNPARRNSLTNQTNPETSVPVLLPSSFISGPRHALNNIHDMLAISMQLGAVTFFVTFTANPAWPEIENSINPGNKRDLKPDIGNRVFHSKQQRFKDLVTKEAFFGPCRYYGYSVEMQKRQIPHSRWIIAVEPPYNSRDPEYIDRFISAEIPDPELYNIICKNYLHLCTEICSPDGGLTCHDVAHIAEIVNSEPGNEIRRYRTLRYVGSSEAHWHLMAYNMYGLSHTVERLTIHTRNDRTVYFADGQAGRAANMAANRDTQLTAFFQLNARNAAAREYLYRDIPQAFVWNNSRKTWTASVVTWYLIPVTRNLGGGPDSHYIRGKNRLEREQSTRRVYTSAQEACHARGLINSGTTFQETLEEAAQCQHPRAFRVLFGQQLALTRPPNGGPMWEHYKEDLTHDLIRVYGSDDDLRYAHGLRDIRIIAEANMVDWTDLNFPEPPPSVFRQLAAFDDYVVPNEEYVGCMNSGQLIAYNSIIQTLRPTYTGPTCFFLNGPGGTGKTFV